MRWHRFPKSPVFPAGHKWAVETRKGGYESDVTALVRSMLEDDTIREDQRAAWERWRNEAGSKSGS
ncbi:MAG TPA: hypothetical protein VGO08_05260 [Burkholderiales bacterium]|jgi:hypothetical protein|nr:hypothetical protein [Burkholderiales bacterium]